MKWRMALINLGLEIISFCLTKTQNSSVKKVKKLKAKIAKVEARKVDMTGVGVAAAAINNKLDEIL